jgi:hypothetical protein
VLTKEEAAVAAEEMERRTIYLAGGAGLLVAGGAVYWLLNSMESAGKKATVQRRGFDNDFPTP